MFQLKPNMLNTIYVISNMHLNYNLSIRLSGHFSPQKVLPLCESDDVGSILGIPKFIKSFFLQFLILSTAYKI
jgi:hypothetical protein